MPAAPLAVTTGPTAMWYMTRATGVVALVLLTVVVVLGVMTALGWATQRWPRFASGALHRNLSLVALLLIVVHVVTTVVDGFAPIGFIDAVIPFHSPYRPLWLGLGAVAFDILVIVAVSTVLRQRIGHRTWRAIHWMAYASWPVAVLHGLGTGTDTRLGPVLLLDAVCVMAVLGAVAWRLADGWPSRSGTRLAGGAAASAFTVAAVAFLATGPLQPGWARRAGTPVSQLSTASAGSGPSAGSPPSSGAATSGGSRPTPPAAWPSEPLSAALTGSLTATSPDSSGHVVVDINGEVGGAVHMPFGIILRGTPVGGGVAMSSGTVVVGSSRGTVTGLDGDRILARVSPGGHPVQLRFTLQIDPGSGTVQGTLRFSPGGSDEGDRR